MIGWRSWPIHEPSPRRLHCGSIASAEVRSQPSKTCNAKAWTEGLTPQCHPSLDTSRVLVSFKRIPAPFSFHPSSPQQVTRQRCDRWAEFEGVMVCNGNVSRWHGRVWKIANTPKNTRASLVTEPNHLTVDIRHQGILSLQKFARKPLFASFFGTNFSGDSKILTLGPPLCHRIFSGHPESSLAQIFRSTSCSNLPRVLIPVSCCVP